MVRCAKEFGLKARRLRINWTRLASTPLPAIAVLKDGGFLLLGKVGDGKVVVQSTNTPRPELMTKADLEAVWDGHIVLMTRRVNLTDLSRRFDITWFLGAIHKYRQQLAEVLLASFFLQLFALASPLFFQVVIDKVLVHHSIGTLDVLVIGLLGIAAFETILGILRTYLFRMPPTGSTSNSAHGCSSICWHCPQPIFRPAGLAIRWRAYANWRTFGRS